MALLHIYNFLSVLRSQMFSLRTGNLHCAKKEKTIYFSPFSSQQTKFWMKHQIQGRFNICSSPGECLVTVHAQVMAWDDKFSGWIPFDGGGISAVSLYQRLVLPSPPLPVEMEPIQAAHPQGFEPGIATFEAAHSMVARYEYFIFGQRIDDKKV